MEQYFSRSKNIFLYFILALTRFLDFKGRSNRQEYWSFFSINFLVILLLFLVLPFSVFTFIFSVCFWVILIPNIAIQVRRLHDIGITGKILLPMYVIALSFIIYHFFYSVFVQINTESDISYGVNTFCSYTVSAIFIILIVLCLIKGQSKTNQYGAPYEYRDEDFVQVTIPFGKVSKIDIFYNSPDKQISFSKMTWNAKTNIYALRWNFASRLWIVLPEQVMKYIQFDDLLPNKSCLETILQSILEQIEQAKKSNPEQFSLSVSYEGGDVSEELVELVRHHLKQKNIILVSYSIHDDRAVFNVAYSV